MASTSSSGAQVSTPGIAFVWFPGAPYTQRAALAATKAALAPLGWRVIQPDNDGEAPTDDDEAAEWIERNTSSTSPARRVALFMDYDLIPWQHVQSRNYCASSYCIRKALIRKNWLHTSVHAYSVKAITTEETRSPLELLPRSWSVELQFADDLDELLIDELYDLAEMLQDEAAPRRWFILKAAMADRGMGIRIFSSLDGLRRILEEFEELDESDDDDEDGEAHENDEASSSAVALGQLRHFVIQEYISTPLLIAPPAAPQQISTPTLPPLRKFHLRAYVVCVGGLQVYLCDEMLALFAPRKYTLPPHDEDRDENGAVDARVHLTNTCLHAQEDDAETGQVNVHLLSTLCDNGAPSSLSTDESEARPLSRDDLAQIRPLATSTIGSVFSAAAKGAGATGWQTWDQSWEVFGVDLLVGRDADADGDATPPLRMWLLEVNAQPDFAQSGDELSGVVEHALKRAVEVGVLRSEGGEGDAHGAWKQGESRDGITLCFSEKMRGAW